MDNGYVVRLEHVGKTFVTRHLLHRDEETQKRQLYTKKVVTAVDHVDFGIRRGEIFGLLGPNGAGKTTTVKMISGLVRPSSGEVFVDGLHVDRDRLKVLRRVGVVLEGTRTSIWPLTPFENLRYFGNLKNMRGRALTQRAYELLDFIGLKEKTNVQVRRLSRGQKQKLAICIALIADPLVLLLDEPTTGLDVQSSRSIKDKIIHMAREQGKSVLVTTHDMHVAQELCDRIGIIDNGKLITCKPTADLLELFSEHVYEFRLDRLPDAAALNGIPGVLGVEAMPSDDGPVCLFHFDADAEQRSRALYAVMDRLNAGGYMLRSLMHRQQTLENVFLQLTAKTAQKR